MLRYLSPILQLFLFLLTLMLLFLCYQEWGNSAPPDSREPFGLVMLRDSASIAAYEQLELGKKLFRNNCAACHAGDMKTNLTGPALRGSLDRWEAHGGQEALYSWIRNSQQMIQEGENLRAQQLWEEWGPTIMNTFINLTDEELAAILRYVENTYVNGSGYISSNTVE
ncbi:MAG: cytochrome c [Bacteroidota bacterium]